jgi:hypothetical protein
MCPMCITSAALMAAGATSTGGVIALLKKKLGGRTRTLARGLGTKPESGLIQRVRPKFSDSNAKENRS